MQLLFSAINSGLSEINQEANISPEVTAEWVSSTLRTLIELIQKHKDKMPAIRQEIKNLFPDRLTVIKEEALNSTLFKIVGRLHPFGASSVPTSLMSHSGAGT